MILDGWEGFMAVKELPGVSALYFDIDGKLLTKPSLDEDSLAVSSR